MKLYFGFFVNCNEVFEYTAKEITEGCECKKRKVTIQVPFVKEHLSPYINIKIDDNHIYAGTIFNAPFMFSNDKASLFIIIETFDIDDPEEIDMPLPSHSHIIDVLKQHKVDGFNEQIYIFHESWLRKNIYLSRTYAEPPP